MLFTEYSLTVNKFFIPDLPVAVYAEQYKDFFEKHGFDQCVFNNAKNLSASIL
jgi:hypothetical protein